MRKRPFSKCFILAAILALPILALSQAAQQNSTLIVNGRPGSVAVVQLNGRSYVEVEALARVASGSLSFKGNQITLTLPAPTASAVPATPSTAEPPNQGFSKEFLRAAIEEMAAIREWRSVLTNAVQHGYPIAEDWLTAYRGQAAKSLTLASVAVTTDSDRDALRLLTNEFDNMQKLSDAILQSRKSMDYISPATLKDDPLDQKIMNCAHSLASMAAGRQFQDDGSCH
ncbi:MAG: hypothetical protein ACHQT6_02075 [Candidatus Acidiferrales bacterium]